MLVDENGNPIAQGQETEPETPEKPSGIEARINELTAKFREAERALNERSNQVAERDAQIATLLTTLAAGRQEPVQTQQVDIDPDEQRKFDALMSPRMLQMQRQLERLEQELSASQFRQVATGVEPEVAKRAQELMGAWKRNGYSGWTPEDAVTYAQGELLRKQKSVAQTANQQRQEFNTLSHGVTSQQNSPPPAQARSVKIPKNIDQLPANKQAEIYEQELGDFSL